MNAARTRLSDAELVDRARASAPEALGAIYQAHGASLFRLAARMLGSAAEAEDVVHDLFVGLPELLRRYEHRERLDAWLRAVVARSCVARMRRDARRERMAVAAAASSQPRSTDPWSAIDLERALSSLSNDERAIVALHQLEGYSHAEIAQLLDITEGASRVRLTRALRRLRHLLESEQ